MVITTSYFALTQHLQGTKISIARYNRPRIKKNIDEIISSFAPSTDLLKDYKNGIINWPVYKARYIAEQRKHCKQNPDDFEELLERGEKEDLILLCYEKYEGPKTKCHRLLLFNILRDISDREDYQTIFVDEQSYQKRS